MDLNNACCPSSFVVVVKQWTGLQVRDLAVYMSNTTTSYHHMYVRLFEFAFVKDILAQTSRVSSPFSDTPFPMWSSFTALLALRNCDTWCNQQTGKCTCGQSRTRGGEGETPITSADQSDHFKIFTIIMQPILVMVGTLNLHTGNPPSRWNANCPLSPWKTMQ